MTNFFGGLNMCLQSQSISAPLSRQKGLSSGGLLLILTAGAFLLTCFFKLGPVYMADLSIKDTLKSIALKNDNLASLEPREIRSQISKYMILNNMRDTPIKDFKITRSNGGVLITNVYEKRIQFIANIDVVMSFKHQLDSNNPSECCEYLIDVEKDE